MLRMTKIEGDESSAIPKNEGRIMSEGVDETAVNPQTQKQEFHIAVLMFLFFFLVIAVFQLLKPLKSGLFVEVYGADVELYAKLSNILLAAGGVAVFSLLHSTLPRQRIIYVLSAFFMGSFLFLASALTTPSPALVWGFYLLGDLEATIMVAAFWAYLTDIANSLQAKRLFGPIGAGGVLGGWLGVLVARLLLEQVGAEGLLVVAAGMMGLVSGTIVYAERRIRQASVFRPATKLRLVPQDEPSGPSLRTEALAGARLVLRSPYLLAIAGLMASYEIASQLLDYQFKLAAEKLAGVQATQAFITDVYLYANILAVVVQFFLVGFVLKRFGLTTALLILPLAIIAGSVGFLATSALAAVSLLVIFDNGLNYSIQQTGRESLYLITSPDEKYKARAFIQMFVQRLAKGVSIGTMIGLGLLGVTAQYLSVLTIGVMLVMVGSGVYAGRHFARVAKREGEGQAPAMEPIVTPSQSVYPAQVAVG